MAIAIFIPVRLGSTRLPQKALLEIAGKPVLEHLLERLKLAQRPDLIAVCTTMEASDDPLVDLTARVGVHCFRGSKDDLLDRFWQAAQQYQVDWIIDVDGDDILVDPEQVDAVADYLVQTQADFVKCDGLPFGAAPIGLKAAALERVCRQKTETDTATGWGRFFTEPDQFHIETLQVQDAQLNYPDLRMTLDYPEDYQFFQTVFRELLQAGKVVRLREAVPLIVSRPDIQAINAGLEQKYWQHFNANIPAADASSA